MAASHADAAVLLASDVSAWNSANATGTGNNSRRNLIDPNKTSAPNANDGSPDTIIQTDPADPSTWRTQGSWPGDSQGPNTAFDHNRGGTPNISTLNGNPWLIFDLGAPTAGLEEMFIWNVAEATGYTRGIADLNLWVADTPTAPLPGTAMNGTLPTTATDYDFTSGGWTQVGGTHTLDRGANGGSSPAGNYGYDGRIDLSGVASARYIGIEALSNLDADNSGDGFGRAGLNFVAFTATPPAAIPEPSSSALLGLGAMALMIRRRR